MNTLNKNQLPSVPKKLVYIAGPYWNKLPERRAAHIAQVRMLRVLVAEAGFFPIMPHCNTAGFENLTELPESFYHSGDLLLLSRCDILLLAPGWEDSKGSQVEIKFAGRKGIPVYTRLSDLLNYE